MSFLQKPDVTVIVCAGRCFFLYINCIWIKLQPQLPVCSLSEQDIMYGETSPIIWDHISPKACGRPEQKRNTIILTAKQPTLLKTKIHGYSTNTLWAGTERLLKVDGGMTVAKYKEILKGNLQQTEKKTL